ncbi:MULTISPECIES: universal stress protein [unclassified Amycolatopsis]|uniref:universal stress protein n=1 Tax=unclassified Amycolatopsis TaxID=2618356 RepID=UPI001C69F5C3|nr:universal stress protein [Amycolatopsis sp. DSM 110486]QYN20297.1 universal stress protein [Amycolatopsis sp. DSM 110486]
MTTVDQSDIVVGVDGSAGSAAALRWALSEAHTSGRRVVALRAWTFDPTSDLESAATQSPQDIEARYRGQLEQAVADALAGVEPVPVRAETVDGAPGPALVRTSQNAAMLVVGSHGHGRLLRLLVGSVSAYCLKESRCPVVVVPVRTAEERGLVPEADAVGTYQPGPLL